MEAISDVEEREEGEIVEDELEEVSDCSLSPDDPCSGKSVPPRDLFRGVSLISIDENKWRSQIRRGRRSTMCRRAARKRRRPPASPTSDSDREAPPAPHYVHQLRTALKHEAPQAHHNNLETRLQLKPATCTPLDGVNSDDDELNLIELRRLALQSKAEKTPSSPREVTPVPIIVPDTPDEPDLVQLRLEALKSVVLTNHERRKQRKLKLNATDASSTSNKENNQSVINNDLEVVNQTPPKTQNPDEVDEDLDILFATVLATLSTNLTSKKATDTLPAPTKSIANPKPSANFTHLPPANALIKVKPLIITLSSDSDTDVEPEKKTEDISNTVDEFLRKQRAEVEMTKTPKTISPANGDKSAVKLLPKSQQLEYRRLKQLIHARKRIRMRKLSQATPSTPTPSSVKKQENGARKFMNTPNKIKVNTVTSKLQIKQTLDELQVHKDGRFQMKGKYEPLAPLLRKVHQIGMQRGLHERRLKALLTDIQDVRNKYFTSHRLYTDLVQQLLRAKTVIDQRVSPKPTNTVTANASPKPITEIEVTCAMEATSLQDPNDVDIAFVETKSTLVPKYISPLSSRQTGTADPLTTFCPFDLLGVCKDAECAYVHTSKIPM